VAHVPRVRFSPGELTAIELPPGPIWRELLERAWEEGGAVLPLDPALPEPVRRELLETARPSAVLRADGLERLTASEPIAFETALVIPTSGSTGRPKLVELGRAAIESAVEASSTRLGATGDDPWLCCLPVTHIGGLLVVLRAIFLGAEVDILERFETGAVGATHAAFASFVPTMLLRALDARLDLTRFRALLIGGAALDPAIRERALGAPLVETYGMTEITGGVVYDGLPLAGTEVRIALGSEIQLRGPTLMTGYRRDPRATGDAFTHDGWLRTRDAGGLEPDDRLTILGRLDPVINTGGVKVRPEPIEALLRTHPKVADVAVLPRADPEWGEAVVAVVVPRDPLAPPTLAELRRFASTRLPVPALPRALEIVGDLERPSRRAAQGGRDLGTPGG
jgi:o-succinylbenzoate---CoA ligase